LFRGHLTPSKYARKDDFAVTSTPTLEGGRVFASDDAAATVMAARTVADGGIDGPPPDEYPHMQHPACWKKGIAIKTEPRILVFRRNTRYYNSVWAVD
jgi:hypothetical protein